LTRSHVLDQLSLSGLPESAVAQMIEALSGRKPPEAVASLIYSETEGNPFFIEELLQHLVDQNQLLDENGEFRQGLKLDELDVPRTVRLSIRRRVARLSDGAQKSIATAAVIGRAFTFELLQESSHADVDLLLDWIEEAEKAGLIGSTLQYPEVQFRFCHELIRQTVASELSGARRQRLHLDIADAIERLYANTLQDHIDDLAHHLYQAGLAADAERTIQYLALAAKRASEQSAWTRAEAQYLLALNLLKRIPETSHGPKGELLRARVELSLQSALGEVLVGIKGYSAPEPLAAFARARELSVQLGEPPRPTFVLLGLWAFALTNADRHAARSLADQILAFAELDGGTSGLTWGYYVQGATRRYCGDLHGAREFLSSVQRYYVGEEHRTSPQDPAVLALLELGWTLYQLGLFDTARVRCAEALALAEQLKRPSDLAVAHYLVGTLHAYLRQVDSAQSHVEPLLEIAKREGFPLAIATGKILKGWVLAQTTQTIEGVELIRSGLSEVRGAGFKRNGLPMALLAEAQIKCGALDEALSTVEDALSSRPEEGWQCYMLLLRGECLVRKSALRGQDSEDGSAIELSDDIAQGVGSLRSAVSLARSIDDKSVELKAALSLARVYLSTGKAADAPEQLMSAYSGFTEGFDTPDLAEAKALIKQLRS
jgi:tetratricopeptide (TPR) repeat protein